jgi:hypothetical protein
MQNCLAALLLPNNYSSDALTSAFIGQCIDAMSTQTVQLVLKHSRWGCSGAEIKQQLQARVQAGGAAGTLLQHLADMTAQSCGH